MKSQVNHPHKKQSSITSSKIKVRNINSMLANPSAETTARDMFVQYVAAELRSLPPGELLKAQCNIFNVIAALKLAVLKKRTQSAPVSSSQERQEDAISADNQCHSAPMGSSDEREEDAVSVENHFNSGPVSSSNVRKADLVFDKNQSPPCSQTSTVTLCETPRDVNSMPNSAPVSPLSGSDENENEDWDWELMGRMTENNLAFESM